MFEITVDLRAKNHFEISQKMQNELDFRKKNGRRLNGMVRTFWGRNSAPSRVYSPRRKKGKTNAIAFPQYNPAVSLSEE